MVFRLCMMVDLCMTSFYAYAHSDDLDIALDFGNVCKALSACCELCTYTTSK